MILFIFRFTIFSFSAFIGMFVSPVNITVSAPCSFLEFAFILSTDFLDYIIKLSILLHAYVKYSQLEIMNECCFSLRPTIYRLYCLYERFLRMIRAIVRCILWHHAQASGANRASYIIRDSISKAPSLCSTNDSACELSFAV